jgi:hypothetical protein
VNLAAKGENESKLSMGEISALADGEGFWGWWDSKVYQCEKEECSVSLTVGIPGVLSYEMQAKGKMYKCTEGSDVAHCWECAGCDASVF